MSLNAELTFDIGAGNNAGRQGGRQPAYPVAAQQQPTLQFPSANLEQAPAPSFAGQIQQQQQQQQHQQHSHPNATHHVPLVPSNGEQQQGPSQLQQPPHTRAYGAQEQAALDWARAQGSNNATEQNRGPAHWQSGESGAEGRVEMHPRIHGDQPAQVAPAGGGGQRYGLFEQEAAARGHMNIDPKVKYPSLVLYSYNGSGGAPSSRRASLQDARRASLQDGERDHTDECVVCMDPLKMGQVCGKLPCGHVFHGDCIRQWYSTKMSLAQPVQCPSCNFLVVSPDPSVRPLVGPMGQPMSFNREPPSLWRNITICGVRVCVLKSAHPAHC